MDSCAFTGHRPKSFPWGYNESDFRCKALKSVLAEQIKKLAQAGVTNWFSGMALGVDVWSAQIVLKLRAKNPALKLNCILPCEDQDKQWTASARELYRSILDQADSVTYVSQNYYNGCMLERNRQLVEASSVLLAVYNGEQRGGTAATVRYAQQAGSTIIIIDPISRNVTCTENRHDFA